MVWYEQNCDFRPVSCFLSKTIQDRDYRILTKTFFLLNAVISNDIDLSDLAKFSTTRSIARPLLQLSFELLVMPPQPMLQWRHYVCACPSRLLFRVIGISFVSQEYWTHFDEICGIGNNHQQQIKWLHFGRNWNRDKGVKYGRKFDSTSIGVAAMSNRCCMTPI